MNHTFSVSKRVSFFQRFSLHAILLIPLAVLGLGAFRGQPAQKKQMPNLEFSELWMAVEQNATDGDTEVVLFAKGQDVGLSSLEIIGPDGRLAADFKGDRRGIGIREFHLESAEPPDLDAVLGSFPEGIYSLAGRTVEGDRIKGTVYLSHDLAPATELVTPQEEEVVPINQLVLSWNAVPGVERYIIELNDETAGTEFTFQVLPPATSMAIPAQFLQRDSEYQFAVGVRMPNGNTTFVETTFFIAP